MITPQTINQPYIVNNYADLSTASDPQINTSSNNYFIFPLSTQVGKVMLVNSSNGIAVAVIPNKGSTNTGDILGTLNGSDPFLQKPTFELSQSAYFQTPSEITDSDIIVKSGTFISMTKSLIDDDTGELSLTIKMGYVPWFESQSSANMIFLNEQKTFNLAKANSFANFASVLPPQYQNMLPTLFTPEILAKINPFTLDLKLNIISKTYKIISANSSNGTLTIQTIVSYQPVDASQTLTYSSNEYTYTWGVNASAWKPNPDLNPGTNAQGNFALYGETVSRTTVNINGVPNLKWMTQNSILPSYFSANNLFQFVDFNKTKYYNINTLNYQVIEANDDTGTLTIQVSGNQQTVSGIDLPAVNVELTYTGFNKLSDYSFAWNTNTDNNVEATNHFLGKNYNDILPSNVSAENVLTDLLKLQGFNNSDFSVVTLEPSDAAGSLTVTLKLKENFPNQLQNLNPLVNGTITTTLTGFLSTEKLSKKYSVNFVANDSSNIAKLKELAPSQITQAQARNFYTIPSSYYFGQTPTITLYPNNINGSLSLVLTFNLPADLKVQNVFVQTYTGFQFVSSTNAYTVIFAATAPASLTQKLPSSITLNEALTTDLLTLKGFSEADLSDNVKLIPNNYLGTLTIIVSFSPAKYPLATITSFAQTISGFLKSE